MKTAKTVKHTVKLAFVKSTKNTHVYKTDAEGVVCDQLYLNKAGLGEEAPAHCTISVEPATKGKAGALLFVKETKNTFVYKTDAEGAVCDQAYLNKVVLGDKAPEAVVLTVGAAK